MAPVAVDTSPLFASWKNSSIVVVEQFGFSEGIAWRVHVMIRRSSPVTLTQDFRTEGCSVAEELVLFLLLIVVPVWHSRCG